MSIKEAGWSLANDPKSSSYAGREPQGRSSPSWLKLALITGASAVAGGLATAWFYRKTLAKLRETGESGHNPHFGISKEQREDERPDEI
jgi:hypothetical protein